MKKILIVEDELILAQTLKEMLLIEGYNVVGMVDNCADAEKKVVRENPDLVLMDIRIKGELDGIETSKKIMEKGNLTIVYLTAYADKDTLERAKITKPHSYLIKPFRETELKLTVEFALLQKEMNDKLQESEKRFRTLFHSSSDPIIIYDKNEVILEANEALSQLTGYELKALKTMNASDLVSMEFEDEALDFKSLDFDNVSVNEIIVKTKHGDFIGVESKCKVVSYDYQKCLLCVWRELSRRNEEIDFIAEQFDEQREELLENISSNLRNNVFISKKQIFISKIALLISKDYGLSNEQRGEIQLAALLMKIGYIKIPDSVTLMNNNEVLINDINKTYPRLSYEILNHIPELSNVARYILFMNKSDDGNGYLDIKEDIPVESMILMVSRIIGEKAFECMETNIINFLEKEIKNKYPSDFVDFVLEWVEKNMEKIKKAQNEL